MKILLWDLETLPIIATTWGLWKPNLSHDNIIEDSSIVCAAWKDLDADEVHTAAVNIKHPRNDKALVKKVRDVLSTADVLVAHNGDKFDLKHLNARLVFHGLAPLPPLRTVDTLKVARRYFRFTSNRLDYLGKHLGLGAKLHTDYSLWLRILLEKDPKALASMVTYNAQDVKLLEAVYLKLRPFMTNHPNQRLCNGESCPICGQDQCLQKRGFRINKLSKAQAYQCQACGGWSTGEMVLRTKVA